VLWTVTWLKLTAVFRRYTHCSILRRRCYKRLRTFMQKLSTPKKNLPMAKIIIGLMSVNGTKTRNWSTFGTVYELLQTALQACVVLSRFSLNRWSSAFCV
jgi:hypothetical protein